MVKLFNTHADAISGVLFVALFASSATFFADMPLLKSLHLSPLIIGMVMGIAYANTLRNRLPEAWVPGILFSTKRILRLAIIFYGFKITFQDILSVGLSGIIISILMVTLTFLIGYLFGTRVLKLDRDTTILTCAGSSICGAAAVLATEGVVKATPYKGTVAVGTVVLFGTIAMFLYPFMFSMGWIPLNTEEMGVYIGGSVHEVAHVVAAGNALGPEAADPAIIVKMIRVLLIAPFLIILGFWLIRIKKEEGASKASNIIPWFAVLFIVMAGINSIHIVPPYIVEKINALDTFALTMAMSALGMETNIDKFKKVGMKPVYLAGFLFLWLILGGLVITKYVMMV